MIKRIELYGPEGAGKTTLYEKVDALRDKTLPQFLLIRDLRNKAVENILRTPDHDWLGLQGFFDRDVFQRASFQQKYLPAIRRRLLLVNHIGNIDNTVLEDEGLLQRGINVAKAGELNSELICEYYKKVPLPSGIIIVSCGLNELLTRNAARGQTDKRLDRGRGAERSIEIVQLAEKVLASRGARILHLDSAAELESNVSQAFNFVMTIKNQ